MTTSASACDAAAGVDGESVRHGRPGAPWRDPAPTLALTRKASPRKHEGGVRCQCDGSGRTSLTNGGAGFSEAEFTEGDAEAPRLDQQHGPAG